MKHFFYNVNGKTVGNLIKEDTNFKYEINYNSDGTSEGILAYKDSEIELFNKEDKPLSITEELYTFKVKTIDTSILKLLFDRYKIYFFDDYANEMTKLLNTGKEKDKKYYDALIHDYIAESMIHLGVIKRFNDLGENFYNTYLSDKAVTIINRKYRWMMVKEIWKIIVLKIKSVFKRK